MSEKNSSLGMLVIFVVWYGFNASYNVFNNYMKADIHFPIFIASSQLAIGLFYAIPLWITGIRQVPNLTFKDVMTILPVVLLNTIGHVFSVLAMFQKGGGSFTHVIKASEPVVSVIVGLFMFSTVPKPLTCLSLLPITYGVAYASTLGNLSIASMKKELMTPVAIMAMIGNIAFAIRSGFRKKLTSEFKTRTGLNDAANEHAVTTLLSFLVTIPLVYYMEPISSIQDGYNAIQDKPNFLKNTFICGMSFYLYNEMQNIVLASLGPVPTAVGNTLKRVVIFVALYFFTEGETFPMPKVIGCAIAVAGCLLFAIFDSKKL